MTTPFFAIDPGSAQSAYIAIGEDCAPVDFGIIPNDDLLEKLRGMDMTGTKVAIEKVASYGMAVGETVFDTCIWTGRFHEAIQNNGNTPSLVKRIPIKMHHCKSAKAKDSNIIQALADRFAPGAPNKGKGTKGAPGWFYGFSKDTWQAYALAVFLRDQEYAITSW